MSGVVAWLAVMVAALAGLCVFMVEAWLIACRDRDKYRGLYHESVTRESLHLMGPLALYGPLEESTPIADALDIKLWDKELES